MRCLLRTLVFVGLSTVAWATTLSAFVCDLSIRVVEFIHDALAWSFSFMPRLVSHLQPVRKILMSATALNDRQVGGVKVRGFLGRPAVMTLAG